MAIPNMSGLSPLAAIRQFSEPAPWAELEQLLGLGVDTTEARAGWSADDWARHDFQVGLKLEIAHKDLAEYINARHRWARLRLAFKERLQSGEIVVTGYVKPVELACERTNIPADKWRFLELDFVNGAASGEGLEIVSILIDRAESQTNRRPDKSDTHRPPVDEYRTGLPGRPSKLKHLIEQEFRRRCKAGEACSTLPAEARALRQWAEKKHPTAPTPTEKTITNNIRDSYNQHARNTAQN